MSAPVSSQGTHSSRRERAGLLQVCACTCMLGAAGVYTHSLNVKLRLSVLSSSHTGGNWRKCTLGSEGADREAQWSGSWARHSKTAGNCAKADRSQVGYCLIGRLCVSDSGLGIVASAGVNWSAVLIFPGLVGLSGGGVWYQWGTADCLRGPQHLSSLCLLPTPQSIVIRGGPGSQHHLQQDSWPGPTAACHLPEPTRCHHCDRGGGADGHR